MSQHHDGWDAASAVELLELYLDGWFEDFKLPHGAARVILECAKRGMRKGQGKGRMPLSETVLMCREAIIAEARQRKAELRTANPDMKAGDAADVAAKEASRLLYERYGIALADSTIVRRIG